MELSENEILDALKRRKAVLLDALNRCNLALNAYMGQSGKHKRSVSNLVREAYRSFEGEFTASQTFSHIRETWPDEKLCANNVSSLLARETTKSDSGLRYIRRRSGCIPAIYRYNPATSAVELQMGKPLDVVKKSNLI